MLCCRRIMSKVFYCSAVLTVVLGGCTSYRVPGRAARMGLFVEKSEVVPTEQAEPQTPGSEWGPEAHTAGNATLHGRDRAAGRSSVSRTWCC